MHYAYRICRTCKERFQKTMYPTNAPERVRSGRNGSLLRSKRPKAAKHCNPSRVVTTCSSVSEYTKRKRSTERTTLFANTMLQQTAHSLIHGETV